MTQESLLALEAANRCREILIQLKVEAYAEDWAVDRALISCEEIQSYCDQWPASRLHRWLGFVFGVLCAREIMTHREQGEMMQELLNAHPEFADHELERHRDPRDPFQLDIGGPG